MQKNNIYYGSRKIYSLDSYTKKYFRVIEQIKKFNLIFMGAPGSGKGTEIQILQKEGYHKISTGDLLRNEVESKSDLGIKLKKVMDSGELVSDDLVIKIMEKTLKNLPSKEGIIFDGFPRTIKQAKKLDKILIKNGLKIDAVIEIKTPDEMIIKRITDRYMCKECGATYNKSGNQPKSEGICDVCTSSEFKTRTDDTEEVVKKRLDSYHKEAKAIIKYYKKQKIFYPVSGASGKAEITDKSVRKVLAKL